VAWIGGAMDAYTQLLRRYVPAGQQYFQWYQYRAIKRWIQQHQQQQTLIIAHSYGASTAAAIVAEGYRVSELITIDPVGWRKPNAMQLRRFCQHWRNYCAADPRLNFANLVARCGGHWHDWPASCAHQHQRLNVDHAMIVSQVLSQWRQSLSNASTVACATPSCHDAITTSGVNRSPAVHRDKMSHLQLVVNNEQGERSQDSRS
jgi:pimeloyl-ACP methyl ester carboxylesterase